MFVPEGSTAEILAISFTSPRVQQSLGLKLIICKDTINNKMTRMVRLKRLWAQQLHIYTTEDSFNCTGSLF